MTEFSVNANGSKVNRRAGDRSNKQRKRNGVNFPPGSVLTDGCGNIKDRPIHGPKCFGDPVEWVRGRHDEPRPPRQPNGIPQPFGCALCPASDRCGSVVIERITTAPKLAAAYQAWLIEPEAAGEQRYSHATYAAFVDECEAHSWDDSADDALAWARAERRHNRAADAARKRKAGKPKPKTVPKAVADAIALEHARRVADILSRHADPKAPLSIRNRTAEDCVLVADAWQARELLEASNAPKVSASTIMGWLIDNQRVQGDLPARFKAKINTALRLADLLWPTFDPYPVPVLGMAAMSPDVVHTILEPDELLAEA